MSTAIIDTRTPLPKCTVFDDIMATRKTDSVSNF